MTENEAIERLKYRIETATYIAGKGVDGNAYEDMEIAIKALEEIRQYRALGTVEELREAMEKQRAKKPYIETEKATGLHEDYDCYECPNCDSFLGLVSDCKDEHYRYDYCPNCGQAIDFSEVKE